MLQKNGCFRFQVCIPVYPKNLLEPNDTCDEVVCSWERSYQKHCWNNYIPPPQKKYNKNNNFPFKNSELVKNLNHGMHDMDYQWMPAFFAIFFFIILDLFGWCFFFYSWFFMGFITIKPSPPFGWAGIFLLHEYSIRSAGRRVEKSKS